MYSRHKLELIDKNHCNCLNFFTYGFKNSTIYLFTLFYHCNCLVFLLRSLTTLMFVSLLYFQRVNILSTFLHTIPSLSRFNRRDFLSKWCLQMKILKLLFSTTTAVYHTLKGADPIFRR